MSNVVNLANLYIPNSKYFEFLKFRDLIAELISISKHNIDLSGFSLIKGNLIQILAKTSSKFIYSFIVIIYFSKNELILSS